MNFYYLPDHYLFNIHFFDDNIFKRIWHQRNGVDTGCTRSKNNLARVLWFGLEKKVINYRRVIDRNENIFHTHRRDIYHAKLDMPRNQMVSVPRSTPVLFKVLRFVWANVHEQPRIRLQTFFIWNMLWRQIKKCLYNETCIV